MLLLAPAIIIAFIWPDFSVSGSGPTFFSNHHHHFKESTNIIIVL
jgi:hypothetical protein